MPFNPFQDLEDQIEQDRKDRLAQMGMHPDLSVSASGIGPQQGPHAPDPNEANQLKELQSLLHPPTPPKKSWLETAVDVAPTVARFGGAAVGMTPLKAMGAGAIGEMLAQDIEKISGRREHMDPASVAAAAAFGGLGGASVNALGKASSFATGAARAVPYAVAQPYVKHAVQKGLTDEQGNFSPVPRMSGIAQGIKDTPADEVLWNVGPAAVIGGAVGALQGKFMGAAKAATEAPRPNIYEVQPTAHPGGNVADVLKGGKTGGLSATPTRAPHPIPGTGNVQSGPMDELGQMFLPGMDRAPKAAPVEASPYLTPAEGARLRGMGLSDEQVNATPMAELRAMLGEQVRGEATPIMGGGAEASSRVGKVMAAEAKATAEAERLTQIRNARAASGAEPQQPSFTEQMRATNEQGGMETMTQRHAVPKPEGEGGDVSGGGQTRQGVAFTITRDIQQRLGRLGYTAEDISRMKPEDAHNILALKVKRPGTMPPANTSSLEELLSGGKPAGGEPPMPPPAAAGEKIGLISDLEQSQPLTKAVAEPGIAPIEEPDFSNGVDRRNGPRLGPQYRGTDTESLLKIMAEMRAAEKSPEVMMATTPLEHTGLGGTSTAPDPRDARVAELMRQPFSQTPEEIEQGIAKIRDVSKARQGAGFERARGGGEPTALAPVESGAAPASVPARLPEHVQKLFNAIDTIESRAERAVISGRMSEAQLAHIESVVDQIENQPYHAMSPQDVEGHLANLKQAVETPVEGPSSPVGAISAPAPGQGIIPLHKSREESVAAQYRELSKLFGKEAKSSTNPVEREGWLATRRAGRDAAAEARGVNTSEVSMSKGGSMAPGSMENFTPNAGRSEPAPLSPEWFQPNGLPAAIEGRIPPAVSSETARVAGAKDLTEVLGLPRPAASSERAAAMAASANPEKVAEAEQLLTGKPADVVGQLQKGVKGKGSKGIKNALGNFLKEGISGASGSVDPKTAARLAMIGAGAAGGAIWDPLDNPLASAVAGGAIGAALPGLGGKIAQLAEAGAVDASLPATARTLAQRMLSNEGQAQVAGDLIESLPSYLRANMLYSQNFANNAFVGPWASGFFGALEYHLAGDPRGTAALQEFMPHVWASQYGEHVDSARAAIQTAEGAAGERIMHSVGPGFSKVAKNYLEAPGVYMTAGDHTTRAILERAGFSAEEAGRMVMTADPESATGKALVNVTRSGPLGQVLLPFSKTLVNIAEQGAQRIPGVGFLAQASRGAKADPMTQQVLQQAIGAGFMGAGYVGGEHLEDVDLDKFSIDDAHQLSLLKSFLTNASGRYALPMAIGIAAGAAHKSGKTPIQEAWSGLKSGSQQLPLPSLDVPFSYGNSALKLGDPNVPIGEKLPTGAVPSLFKQYLTYEEPGVKSFRKKFAPKKPHIPKPGGD